MAKLNDNNFLVWEGNFTEAPFDVIANDDNVSMVYNAASKVISALANDIATYQIDKPSFEFTLQDNPGKPAIFDPVSGNVTYYPPAGAAPGQVRQLKYRWYDKAGHVSNNGTINITMLDRAVAWRGYAPSYQCEKDVDDENTGIAFYATLEKYYTDTNASYFPQTLKVNAAGDPDYIAPAQNLTLCPLPNANVPFYVWNYVGNAPSIVVQDIIFKNAGVTVAAYVVNNGGSVGFQPAQIQVPSDTDYDELMVRMTILNISAAGNHDVTWTPGAGGAGGGTEVVNFPAVNGAIVTATFAGIKTGTAFAGDVTLN